MTEFWFVRDDRTAGELNFKEFMRALGRPHASSGWDALPLKEKQAR